MPDNDQTRTHPPDDGDATLSVAPAPDYDATALGPLDQAAALAPDSNVSVPGLVIEGVLGRGGMGVVYRAHEPALGRDVAVKVLHDRHRGNPAAGRRFEVDPMFWTKSGPSAKWVSP